MKTLKKIAAMNHNMKTIMTALPTICICMVLLACSTVTKKKFFETKAKAETGDTVAQYNLGSMYWSGEGVLIDHKQAVNWYRKAAEQGHANAQYNLGGMYEVGHGVQEDLVTAYAWAKIAQVNGNKGAPKFKSLLKKEMTPDQIVKGETLSKEMIKKNPKLISKQQN